MDKLLVAHELGHAVCAEVQDPFWTPIELDIESDDDHGSLATASFDKLDKRKPYIKSYYAKFLGISDLGGLFGEMLYGGKWSPWAMRSDIDSFVTANRKKHPHNDLIDELDDWYWISDGDKSFRACSEIPTVRERRRFKLDSHDTVTTLPYLWGAYIDFCDRIDKDKFREAVNKIVSNRVVHISNDELKVILKDVIKNGD